MFHEKHSKIKNEKIMRWRLELSCYSYDIVYRPGKSNLAADALSRVCNSISSNKLYELHQSLCHPGVTRMNHFIKIRNLPYSTEEIKQMTSACPICAEMKPRFYRNPGTHLIKATAPFERLNIDFKGPLPTSTKNAYMLTVIDEYSRFPFAFPCKDTSSITAIECLNNLFCLFGMPSYIHSDRGTSFTSKEFLNYLQFRGIASSRTTPYNPEGNGQVERYNGIIWKAVNLALKSRSLLPAQWEIVLPDALHSIRSLLCTATNCTPHERIFNYQRRSTRGTSIPSWLKESDLVFLKKHIRQSKYDPLVEEVELLEVNPDYALVRHENGRESTVSVKHLGPRGNIELLEPNIDSETKNKPTPDIQNDSENNDGSYDNLDQHISEDTEAVPVQSPQQRRSTRFRNQPKYLAEYVEK